MLWLSGQEAAPSDFTVALRGGPSLQRAKGVPYDAFQGMARKGPPEEWCTAAGLQKTMRFSTKEFGEGDACILAKAFCHRM
eukprot:3544507-Lingulodinium_polyedra.AAC.1